MRASGRRRTGRELRATALHEALGHLGVAHAAPQVKPRLCPFALRVLVRTLRQKLEADPQRPRIITNELGIGYRLRTDAEAGEPAA